MEGPSPNYTVLCWVGVVHRYMLEWPNGELLNFKVSKLVKSLLSLPLNSYHKNRIKSCVSGFKSVMVDL